jgi:hypothetical protein
MPTSIARGERVKAVQSKALHGSSSTDAVDAASSSTADDDPTKIFDVPDVAKIRKRQRVVEDATLEIVESDPLNGSEIFNNTRTGSLLLDVPWDPRTAKESAVFFLPNFGIIYDEDDALLDERQTLVILIKVPEGAKQWAVNICPANHLDNHNILLHFNPRYAAGKGGDRKELVFNDREGTWGPAFKERIRPEGRTRVLLNSTIELALQIRKDGFAIFVNQVCQGLFPHRRTLSTGQQIVLSLPTCDDMASPQEGIVHKVWWGRLPHSTYSIPSDLVNSETAQKWMETTAMLQDRPAKLRSVIVTGLPKQTAPKELQFVEEGIKTVFGVREIEPESINVVPGKGVAYVRLESVEQQQDALKSLQRYKIEDTEGNKFPLRLEPFV